MSIIDNYLKNNGNVNPLNINLISQEIGNQLFFSKSYKHFDYACSNILWKIIVKLLINKKNNYITWHELLKYINEPMQRTINKQNEEV